MNLRWLDFKLWVSVHFWNCKVAFIRITWRWIVAPIHARYAVWINRNMGYGTIDADSFIFLPKTIRDYEEDDRYDGGSRHVR